MNKESIREWTGGFSLNRSQRKVVRYKNQIINLVVQKFENREYPPDFRMPTMHEFAKYLNIHPGHVMRAYEDLNQIYHILYSVRGRGTFMIHPCVEQHSAEIKVRLPTIKIVNRHNSHHLLRSNFLTLGHSDYGKRLETDLFLRRYREFSRESAYPISGERMRDLVHQMLLRKGVASNDQSNCIVPGRKAISELLIALTEPGDTVVLDGLDDAYLMNELEGLTVNTVMIGSDEEGLMVNELCTHCGSGKVRVMLLRPGSDHSSTAPMSSRRWNELLTVAVEHKLVIIVYDDHYDDLKIEQMDVALNSGLVIYVFPFSRVSFKLERIDVVVAPFTFIEQFSSRVLNSPLGWNELQEEAVLEIYSKNIIQQDMAKIAARRKNGLFKLKSIFSNYSDDLGEMCISNSGNFAMIHLRQPIPVKYITQLIENKLFYRYENALLDLDKPIERLDVNLFSCEWNLVESIFKLIRQIIAENR